MVCKGSSVNSWFDSNNVETQVSSNGATKDEKAYVELKISDGPLVNANLLAHWGAIKAGKRYRFVSKLLFLQLPRHCF